MANTTHINITIDFRQHYAGDAVYDLRIPNQLTVSHLLRNVIETLHLDPNPSCRKVKVITKNLVLADDDLLKDYPVADGDILVVLS